MSRLLYAANALVVVGLIFGYLSPYVNPNITWFFSFFGLGFPFLLLANMLFVFFWLVVKPKYALMSGIFLALGFGPMTKIIGMNNASKDQAGLKVMTYNIGNSRFNLFKKNNQAAIKKFKSLIQNIDPDVICIQERHSKLLEAYKVIFSGYKIYPDNKLGTVIYSKYPIEKAGNIKFDSQFHNATWADIKVKKKKIRVYSTHLSSNHVPNLTYNVKEIWDESPQILKKYNEHARIRVRQLNQLLTHARKSPHPVIISGDFNDVPQSYIYKQISNEFTDAFCEAGSGLVQTLRTRMLGLRIDYTFTSPEIKVLSQEVIKSKISDHYPVITTIDVNNLRL